MILKTISKQLLRKLAQQLSSGMHQPKESADPRPMNLRQIVLCRWLSVSSSFCDWATFYDDASALPENRPPLQPLLALEEELAMDAAV